MLAEDEGEDVAKALGPHKAALLRNHGLLTVGETIEEATGLYYTLDRVCHVQLLADAAGEPNKVSHEEAIYTRGVAGSHKANYFSGRMHFDLIDALTEKKYMQ